MKPVEDEEESVDAIAAELEKSDPEVKKAGVKSPKKGSAKKGPKKDGEKEEDWVSLIFGENGEIFSLQLPSPPGRPSRRLREVIFVQLGSHIPDKEQYKTPDPFYTAKIPWTD